MKTIEEMREFIEMCKAERGGTELSRKQTTEEDHATVTRIDEAVRPVLIRYAQLVHESQQVPDIDTSKLKVFLEELELVRLCDDWRLSAHATVLSWTMAIIIHRYKYEAPQLSRQLFMALNHTKGGVPHAYN
ncbi:hypothetical protein [Peribacillus sp. TH14]|uniref:hypothetical protein n=1 Tax=Peribacillus sp. TH14 TaxID=2798481 RepID=UPI001911B1AE|nr:hypothetical protein [Peribacillus sp. TH14]MBK5500931.1 hypothetical protein [Peribacillus sp. TH14]